MIFLIDKQQCFSRISDLLELGISTQEIDDAIKSGAYLMKAHPDDISEFVENHEEVKDKFGGCFFSWS